MVEPKIVKTQKGFTLIELMLATSLLMLVMFSGYYAYSLYTQKWQKRVQVFWNDTEHAMALDAINKMMQSVNAYVVKGTDNKSSIYFSATSNKMSFVTYSPLFSQNSALVELSIQDVNGTSQLIYKERRLQSSPLIALDQIKAGEDWHKKALLLSNLQNISWSFFGWTNFEDALAQSNMAEINDIKESRQWYTLHDTDQVRVLPLTIQMNIRQKNINSQYLIPLPKNTVFKLISALRVDA